MTYKANHHHSERVKWIYISPHNDVKDMYLFKIEQGGSRKLKGIQKQDLKYSL